MSKEPRYALIGAFVLGAAAFLMAAVIFLGRGRLFEDTTIFVAYFGGSVKGLSKGAAVSFRGAKVGVVKDVSIVYKQEQDELLIPVLIELDGESVKGLSTTRTIPDNPFSRRLPIVERMVNKGLRAQLALESLVTGQLFVQLDFMPGVPPRYHPEYSDGTPEIPTAPSSFEKVQATLQQLPLTELASKTVSSITKLETILTTAQDEGTVAKLSSLLSDVKRLADNLDNQTKTLSGEVKVLAERTAGTADQATKTLQTLDTLIKKGEPVVGQGAETLEELGATLRAVRRLADYVERYPESVLRAKE